LLLCDSCTEGFITLFLCVYMFYTSNWFISSIILLTTPLPFLWWLPQVSVFHIHSCIESTSSIFILFAVFIYLPHPVLHSCPSLFRCLFAVQWGFYLGILPINILCLSQFNPPSILFLTLFPHPAFFNSFQWEIWGECPVYLFFLYYPAVLLFNSLQSISVH
jgi:hypothetical protein